MKIHDATAGFKCYRRNLLDTFDFDRIKFKGYAFQIEMKYISHRLGFKLKEVPIIFTDRQEGTSKISGNIIWEAVFGVIKLRLSGIKKYRKSGV
jgi:dolichol-phosphate mannosyltransferase